MLKSSYYKAANMGVRKMVVSAGLFFTSEDECR